LSGAVRQTWKTVRDTIYGRILDSTYGPGDKLPKDGDIAATMGCARATVQRAMSDLAGSGIIERRRKGGTTVRRYPLTRAVLDIPITRTEVEQRGGVYGYQLVAQSTETTPFDVAARFHLSTPVTMLRVRALHLADQRPHMLEDRWISTRTVPEIAEVDLAATSANEWLVRNRPYSRCDVRLYATKASARDAALLKTSAGEALLVLERTTWIGDDPITTVKAVAAPGYQLMPRTRA